MVRQRYAQHLADDDDGQGIGEFLDQVHVAGAGGLVEQAVDDLLDVRAELLDDAGRESLADQAPEAGMVRRIAVEHGQAEAGRRLAEARGHEGGDGLLDEPWVA